MGEQAEEKKLEKPTKHICAGLLAHVDAGKTTLSERILYLTGRIRKLGRVDTGDTYLDTYEMERSRGITIFSKQAVFPLDDWWVTLLDTPGHVDFSAEMERTLQVLDYAVLVISGADGVQGHTKTLWRLLKRYEIPAFCLSIRWIRRGQIGNDCWKNCREGWMKIVWILDSHQRSCGKISLCVRRRCWKDIWKRGESRSDRCNP